MRPSDDLLEFLRAWEGPPHCTPRPDPVATGIYDIGYGHVCAADHPPVDLMWCEDRLRQDARLAMDVVDASVAGVLAQHEADALCSFVFNVGAGRPDAPGQRGKDGFARLRNGQPSTMLRMLNDLDFDGAADQFARWTMSGGLTVRGLIKRRAAERAMFVSGIYTGRP